MEGAEDGGACATCRPYAVVRARDWRDDDPARLTGAALRLVRAGGLAVVVGDLAGEAVAGDAAAGSRTRILLHDVVVERLARRGAPVAPMAVGAPPSVDAALAGWLTEAGASLAELLDRLDGRCEIGVLAWWDRTRAVAALAPAGPGDEDGLAPAVIRERLLARLARDPALPTFLARRELAAREVALTDATRDRLAAETHARLLAAAELGRLAAPPSDDLLLDAAYLVRREALALVDDVLRDAAHRCAGAVTLRRSTPRAARAFATLHPFTRATS
jgi:hypothetical protein